MNEEFTLIGWKCNELLYYWRGDYWRWTSSYHPEKHKFELLKEEHREGWHV